MNGSIYAIGFSTVLGFISNRSGSSARFGNQIYIESIEEFYDIIQNPTPYNMNVVQISIEIQPFGPNKKRLIIPPEIGEFKNIKAISLMGLDVREIPPEIGELKNLESLKILDCNLRSIPPEIGNLSQLQRLGVAHNNLTSLPKEIGNLINLTILSMEGNKITSLPKEIANLKNLNRFYFSENPIVVDFKLWQYFARNAPAKTFKKIGLLLNPFKRSKNSELRKF